MRKKKRAGSRDREERERKVESERGVRASERARKEKMESTKRREEKKENTGSEIPSVNLGIDTHYFCDPVSAMHMRNWIVHLAVSLFRFALAQTHGLTKKDLFF